MARNQFERALESETAKPNELILAFWRIRRLRGLCNKIISRLEGHPMVSATRREILKRHYDVEVGLHSYGSILEFGRLPRGTRVGAWCSVGRELNVRRREHPIERLTQHPYFYNHVLGFVDTDTIHSDSDNPLTIGNDVWIADRVTILANCRSIGNGAVLAAGAVVTKDVAPYTIVGGIPAKPIKRRFDESIIGHLEDSKWWQLPLRQIVENKELLCETLTEPAAARFADWARDRRLGNGKQT